MALLAKYISQWKTCGVSGVVNAVDSVRFSDLDVQRLFALYQERLADTSLSKRDFSEFAYGSEPSGENQKALDVVGRTLIEPYKHRPLPQWCKHLCHHRDLFYDTAIGLSDEDGEIPKEIFTPHLVKQSPQFITWLRFTRRESWQWILDENADALEDRFVSYQNSRQFINDSVSLNFDDLDSLVVLPHVVFRGGGLLFSIRDSIPWEDFIAHHPPKTQNRSGQRDYSGKNGEVRAAVRDKLLESMPWLTTTEFDKIYEAFLDEEEKLCGGGPCKPPAVHRQLPPLDEHVVAADLMDELRTARARHDDVESPYTVNFYHWLLGGGWTALHVGRGYDRCAVKSRACTAAFTKAFTWTTQKSFSLTTYEGEENAVMLAKGCCHRAHFFYEQWKAHGKPLDFDFNSVVHAYLEFEEWIDWAMRLDNETAAYEESAKIRVFVPQPR